MRTIIALPLLAIALAACTAVPDGARPADSPQPVADDRNAQAPYRAIGTEPFWDLTIDGGGLMVFTDRGNSVAVSEPTPPVRIGFAGETFTGRRLLVNVAHSACSDGMSDRSYPDTVNVTVDGHRYRGCGAPGAFFTSPSR